MHQALFLKMNLPKSDAEPRGAFRLERGTRILANNNRRQEFGHGRQEYVCEARVERHKDVMWVQFSALWVVGYVIRSNPMTFHACSLKNVESMTDGCPVRPTLRLTRVVSQNRNFLEEGLLLFFFRIIWYLQRGVPGFPDTSATAGTPSRYTITDSISTVFQRP